MTTQDTHNTATHFPRRANLWFAGMSYAAEVNLEGRTRMELGQPPALDADGIVDGASINSAVAKPGTGIIADHRDNMGEYGRNVTIVLSGAGTPSVIIYGLDYLGQPMSETLTGSGTTPVLGLKAFKEVTGWSSDAVAATTIDIGWGNALGLPFACGALVEEYVNGVAPTAGTKTIAILVTQTATTGDPRGTYTPHSSALPNGSRDYVIVGYAIEGDYYGLQHFTA